MLVVIAIIGILAALLVPALFAAVNRAREAAIAADINQLEMSLAQYQNNNNDYPPNFYEPYDSIRSSPSAAALWAQTVLGRHLKRLNRSATAAPADPRHPLNVKDVAGNYLLKDPNVSPASGETYIDGAECLVFWLGGLSSDAQHPITGANGPAQANPANGNAAFLFPLDRSGALFEFREAQLKDVDGDGFYEYYPGYPSDGPPYVYFDSRSFDNGPDVDGDSIPDDDVFAYYPDNSGSPSGGPNDGTIVGYVKPYVIGATSAGLPIYANAKKFQVISAGLDGRYGTQGGSEFGVPMARKTYLTVTNYEKPQYTLGVTYSREDEDNIANFSEARPLGDDLP
jgi:type II secretory pathway pseudopilin PulG